jgi:hypothetical protein
MALPLNYELNSFGADTFMGCFPFSQQLFWESGKIQGGD